MTDQAMSPLRRRMIEDMTIRKFAPKTQSSYIRAVKNFTVFLGRAPDQASAEDLRRYQLHLASSGVAEADGYPCRSRTMNLNQQCLFPVLGGDLVRSARMGPAKDHSR